MKNRPPKTGSQSISSAFETINVKTIQKTNVYTKAGKKMVHPPIKPHSRVWEKIQAILDEQDNRRNDADQLITSSFGMNSQELKRKKVY